MKKALFVFLTSFLGTHNVTATTFCTTKVDQVYIDATGTVVAHGSAGGAQPYAGWQALCNVNNSATQYVCYAWLAMVGQALGEQATTFILQTGYEAISNCSQIPPSYPSPSSVMMFR
jgi:hypothetical protein